MTDKINMLKQKVDDVKDTMIENIELVIKRGDDLDDIASKAQMLTDGSYDFHRSSKSLKNRMLFKYIIGFLLFLVIILIIITIIIIIIIIYTKN